MATKLEREAVLMASKMEAFAQEVDSFGKRKLGTLPKGAAWTLLRASLALISAASKVQLEVAKKHVKDTKAHFAETGRP
jgi:hypothetical protein